LFQGSPSGWFSSQEELYVKKSCCR
jgi:hypothetical protein